MNEIPGCRPAATRLPIVGQFVFLATLVLASLSVAAAGAAAQVPNSQAAAAQTSGGSTLKDWLAPAATITAAVLAGLFAIVQLRRSVAAQRALEREKLLTAQTLAELAQVRSANREYRQAQALPFLEQLDRTLNESYKAAQFPPYFPDLGVYVPQLRRYADRAMHDWLGALEEMSRHRMRLLLVLGRERVKTVTQLLTEFMDDGQKILEARNQVWFKQASQHDLWEAQRSYVRVGYRLMMEVREAVSVLPEREEVTSSESEKAALAESLTMPFEKASTVSIPYGSYPDSSWVAIWEVDLRPEWQQFVQSVTKDPQAAFENQLKSLTKELYEQGKSLDVKLVKTKVEDLEVPCLAVSFASAARLQQFLGDELAAYRQKYPTLWSSHRAPIEIVIGFDGKKAYPTAEETPSASPATA